MQITSVIVGTRFQGVGAVRAVAQMRVGDVVRLERDRRNPHDRKAVKCFYLGLPIGYLPRQTNPPVAAALDDGATVSAEVRQAASVWSGRVALEPVLLIQWTPKAKRKS